VDPTFGQAVTAALLVYAALAGVVIVEGLRIAFGRIGVRRRLVQLQCSLRAFQAATDDDSRQRLMLRAGLRTLSLSLLLFFALLVACAVMALPLPWVEMNATMLTTYMMVLTVVALAWWHLRHGRG